LFCNIVQLYIISLRGLIDWLIDCCLTSLRGRHGLTKLVWFIEFDFLYAIKPIWTNYCFVISFNCLCSHRYSNLQRPRFIE
jgi:hypothetical protein